MTELIASIAGPYLLVSGLGFIFSTGFYGRMIEGTPKSDPMLINLSGVVHFLTGMVILTNHWMWSGGVEISVSLLGVAASAKGFTLIALPELTLKSSEGTEKILKPMGMGFVVVGAYFAYIGYLA